MDFYTFGSLVLLMSVFINNNVCAKVIYHLNDSEYERMPPLFSLNDYELCLGEPNGTYCLVELNLHEGRDTQLFSMIKDYSEHTVKHYNHTYIQRGVCIQKTCKNFINDRSLNKTGDLNKILQECLNNSIWNEYDLEARIKLLNYCDKNDDAKAIDISDWFVAGAFAVIIAINLIGSLYDVIIQKRKPAIGNQYLLSFSVLRNWQWLITEQTVEARIDRLKGLHGFRTITICLMIIAHVMWVNSMGFTVNSHDFEKAYESIHYQLIFNGMVIIQIFIVQSGFLLAYNLLVRSEKQPMSWKMFPRLIFMRWWRLTPPYAVLLAFTASWLRHVGSGPLWRLWVADSVAADCRRYWWLHLLFINNYVADDRFCAIQTWYLGAEMQVFAVSLFVFLVTKSRGRAIALAFLVLAGSLLSALHVYFQDLDAIMIMDPEFYRKKMSATFEVHVMGHNYLSCYAIGMAAACLLHHRQKHTIDNKRIKVLGILCWYVLPALACLFLSGRVFYWDAARAPLAARAPWAAAHRLLMSGIAAFAVISLAMRFSESYCSVLESPAWLVPSRLCYCVFLVHMNFLHVLMGTRAYLAQVSFYNMMIVYLGVVVLSFLAALPLYLLVEAPAARLLKAFTTR